MNKFLEELTLKSEAGDINAQVNLLFRMRYDLKRQDEARIMGYDLKDTIPYLPLFMTTGLI